MTQNDSKKWLGWDVSMIAIAIGLVACGRLTATDAYNSLQIVQAQVITGTSTADCSVPGTPTSVRRTSGTLDVALPDGFFRPYYLPIVVANNLDPVGGSKATEMNNITLSHFTVELSAAGVAWSNACPSKFDTQSISDFIPPGGTVGQSLDIITPAHSLCIARAVAAQSLIVTAKITAKGRHGGTTIESAPFIFPVEVCAGCLQENYVDPALVVYRYPANYPLCAALTGTNPYSGDIFLPPGQDATILCCGVTTTVGGASVDVAVCPGVFTGTTATATDTATTP